MTPILDGIDQVYFQIMYHKYLIFKVNIADKPRIMNWYKYCVNDELSMFKWGIDECFYKGLYFHHTEFPRCGQRWVSGNETGEGP